MENSWNFIAKFEWPSRIKVMVPLRHFQIIFKTFPYYKKSPDIWNPNSRDPSSVYLATTVSNFIQK